MDKAKTLEVVEKVIDKVEPAVDEALEVAETVDRIPRLRLNGTTRKQQIIILTTTAVVGAAVGGTATYFVVKKRLRTHYEELMQKEAEETKEYFSRIHKVGPYGSPEEALETLHGESVVVDATEAHASYLGLVADEDIKPDAPSVVEDADGTIRTMEVRKSKKNVFTTPVLINDAPDIDDLQKRTEEAPYVITHDEYYEGEKDYEQADLTYYQGDDVLVDERDQPVPDEEIVGPDNLTRFGQWSKNENIVYVRNDKVEVDFEITRSFGKYTKEVLGFDDAEDELKHSARQGVRRFRSRDD